MSGSDFEKAKNPPGGNRRSEPRRVGGDRPYAAPRVTRVRIETSRMTLGYQDADHFCTIHDHDTGIDPCTIN